MIFKEFARRFARYIKPYWWQSSIVFAFMVLAIASSLAFPYILMILIDEVLPTRTTIYWASYWPRYRYYSLEHNQRLHCQLSIPLGRQPRRV